jgi:Tol biopolymer transport system component
VYAVERETGQTFDRGQPRLYPDADGWMHVSATRDLTIYTTYLPEHRTARFPLMHGGYPERQATSGGLHPGGHPAIASDERYIVFDSDRPGGLGETDLYVCFRRPDGSWGEAVNLGERVNSPGSESIPHFSPDGKFLFYTARRDIYWLSTDLIDELRPPGE